MNIAILSDRLTKNGGTESYLLDLIYKYLNQGDSITVFTTKLDHSLDVLNNSKLEIVIKSLFYCPKKLRFPFYYDFLKRNLKKQNFDLVIGINTPYSPDIGICCGTYLGDLKASSWTRKINPLNYVRILYEKKKYINSKSIITHSNLSKHELIDLYKVPHEKIKTVYPIPSLKHFKWKSKYSINEFRNKYKLSNSKTYFLFSSNSHKRKGLKIIIAALNLLNDENIVVLVAGTPNGKFEKRDNIKHLGYIKDIHELYQACDATLLPSTYEPFGLVVVESLMSGTPVIISRNVGARDLVSPSHGFVLENLTAMTLANAMMKYRNDNAVAIDQSSLYKSIDPYINHHQMIKEIAYRNNHVDTHTLPLHQTEASSTNT